MQRLEALWWLFTAVLVALVVGPVYLRVPDFPYLLPNIAAIVAAVTFTRYTFLLRISWLDKRYVWMALLVFTAIPVCFYIGQYLNYFTTFIDNNGIEPWVGHLSEADGKAMMSYLRAEFFLFGICAILAGILMPFAFIRYIWRDHAKRK